ncbi:MAG TPA: MFS transporter [Tepidiformaceae bacterium]|nr:MFS transporter [Tepidiformaceae bacterium]
MSYRWAVIIGLVSAVNSAAMLVSLSVGIMLPDIKAEFSLNPAQAGVLGAVSPLATILLSVPLAALISRFNPRLMIFVGAVHMAVFGLLMAWAPTYELTLLFRFVFMVGLVGRQASMAMLIHQWFVATEVPRVQSVTQVITSSVQIAAFAVLPWLLIWLDGWRNTYFALATLLGATALVWLLVSRDRETESEPARPSTEKERTPMSAILRHRIIWYWGVGTAFCLVGVSAFMTFLPTYLHEERGLSLGMAGLITAGIPLGNVMGAMHAGWVRNRVTVRRQQMYLTGVLCSTGMLTMALVPVPWLVPVGAFALGWACMQVFPTIMTLPYELPGIKPREIAVVSSFLFTLFTFGLVIGPLLTGALQQATGSLRTAFLIVPLVHMGIFIVAFASEHGLPPLPRVQRDRARAVAVGAAAGGD